MFIIDPATVSHLLMDDGWHQVQEGSLVFEDVLFQLPNNDWGVIAPAISVAVPG